MAHFRSLGVLGVLGVAAMLSVFTLTGCVNQNSWTPTIDTANDPNADRISQDEADCRQLAHQASGGTVRKTAEGMGIGAAIGAVTGAVLGAIVGTPGRGAALGATMGGVGGGVSGSSSSSTNFKQVFKDCMRGRGHRVLGGLAPDTAFARRSG